MLVFPNCKINLGLHITQKRPDGFHNMETVFYPLPLCDCLEVIAAADQQTLFSISGKNTEFLTSNNICEKAYQLLASHHTIPPVKMHLHKNIPTGAGLGGGSADAAFTLLLLNKLFDLQLGEDQLQGYAAQLGSDCAFFVINRPSYACGRGEILTPCPVSLKGYYIVLVKPPVHISTAEAFSHITPQRPSHTLVYAMEQGIKSWKKLLVNDFERSVFKSHGQLSKIKQQLYEMGAVYASMSGSGSSIYGLFEHKPGHTSRNIFENCFVWEAWLE